MRSKEGEWATNLARMLEKLEVIKKLPTTQKGIHLHLGSGPLVLPGFINIDKYHKNQFVFNYDMFELPFHENSVDTIYTSHALEHLPIRQANAALKNWFQVLEKGGTLYMAIPDLEEIMRIMLDPEVDEIAKWTWYVYTLFGYQITPGSSPQNEHSPVDLGQFHTGGYTKDRIRTLLEHYCGFTVKEMYNYDGWSTPSIWIEAVK